MTKKEQLKQEAIAELRELLKPGDTVYTVLRYVSRSGMSRGIDVYLHTPDGLQWITASAGHAIGRPQSLADWQGGRGLRIRGCGEDMGLHVVKALGYVLFPDVEYALRHAWI